MEQVKSKKGRKKISEGGTHSPRSIIVVCAALVAGELVQKEITCKESDSKSSKDDILLEASQIFKKQVGSLPTMLAGPFYPRTGASAKANVRKTVNIPVESLEFVAGLPGTAVYKGWNVATRFIANRDDAVFIQYKEHVSEDKKTKPQNKVVLIEALSDFSPQ
jgi:hypothetical protein